MKIFAVLVTALLLSALLYWWPGESENAAPAAAQNQTRATPVDAIRLETQAVTVHESMPGRTAAYKMAEIRPQVTGIVTERLFVEGSEVKAGDALYQIDAAPYQAALKRAQADLEKAKANVSAIETKRQRFATLVGANAVSKQDYDDIDASLQVAKADIGIAEAALQQARIDLEYTKVYAPISGRIGKSLITQGALVTANQSQVLAVITQLDPIYVDISLSSNQWMNLRSKLSQMRDIPVGLKLAQSSRPYPHQGELQFAEVQVEPSTGAVQLRALFPNPDAGLLPGLFVRAELAMHYEDVLLLPQRAAQRAPDGNLSVWRVTPDNRVEAVSVNAERTLGDAWLVEDGLQAGDRIVVRGLINLRPGAQVVPALINASNSESSGGAPLAGD